MGSRDGENKTPKFDVKLGESRGCDLGRLNAGQSKHGWCSGRLAELVGLCPLRFGAEFVYGKNMPGARQQTLSIWINS